MPRYPKNKLAQLVISLCEFNKIKNVVISPGSRNAPLTIGFAAHPEINAFSVVDERSAAFFALGMAQQKKEPVAVVCTSGSALLNYYPAVAEAYYSRIPLVVISADRPKRLIDIGDGQTIRQENIFASHILFSANLREIASVADKDSNESLIQKALKTAREKSGPVHINVPFDEPLYELTDKITVEIHKPDQKPKDSLLDETPLEVDELQIFADFWNSSAKKMVLLGTCYPNEMIQRQMDHMVKDPSVLVLTETTSNIHNPDFVNSIDQLIFPLNDQEFTELQPEILLTFGGMVVSKKVKQFLRKFKPQHHWHIDKYNAPDTYHSLSHHFKISPQLFFSQFFFLTNLSESNYKKKWIDIRNLRKEKHADFLTKTKFSDLRVFENIFKSLPEKILLQLSNSSVVRYAQLFDLPKNAEVFCNRGTSGIDGSTSTAVGAAFSRERQTVFVTGDISFLYDSNALWNKYIRNDFRIIMINNSGGGIFRFIPGPKETDALEYFETPHKLTAKPFCELYGFEYVAAVDEKDFKAQLKSFYKPSEKPKILEIFTDHKINDLILKEYFQDLTKQ